MPAQWELLAWLGLALIALFFFKRWISQHLQGLGLLLTGSEEGAVYVYFAFLLPGIVIHELSHWLMAKLLGMRTGRISLRPSRKRGRRFRLGSVEVRRVDPFRDSLVGLAPLLGGSLAILLIGWWAFDLESWKALLAREGWKETFSLLTSYTRIPDFWLWLYLVFSISNAMLPSESDREPWRPVLIFLALAGLGLYWSGWASDILGRAAQWLLGRIRYLVYTLGFIAAVDVLFAPAILLLEKALSAATGRRVKY